MSFLKLSHINKQIGASNFTLSDINLSLEKGKIMALVGESGSGKTSLLRLISGLEMPDSGFIELEDKTWFDLRQFVPAEKRNIAYVFQEYALFPHLTVKENILFGIKNAQEKETLCKEMLHLVQMEAYASRYPSELSGGEQQRVALARALASKPQLLLMDEPFSNLDELKKSALKNALKAILQQTQSTVIFVTHDTEEALFLADKIVVMQQGKIWQQGSPEKIYNLPVTQYIASFFGKSNFFHVDITHDNFVLPFDFPLNKVNTEKQKKFLLSIRPHDIIIHPQGQIAGIIVQKNFLGTHLELQIKVTCKNQIFDFCVFAHPASNFELNATVQFDIRPNAIHCILV